MFVIQFNNCFLFTESEVVVIIIIIIIIIVIIFLQGLGQRPFPVQNLTSELMNLFGHLAGLLGRGISPTQGLYLYSTTQLRKTRTYIHAPSRIQSSEFHYKI
jgi:hypothetical protein